MKESTPEGAVCHCVLRGRREGQPSTIADGLRTCLGSHTFPIVRDCVDDIICVSEDAIRGCVRLVWERMKLVRLGAVARLSSVCVGVFVCIPGCCV